VHPRIWARRYMVLSSRIYEADAVFLDQIETMRQVASRIVDYDPTAAEALDACLVAAMEKIIATDPMSPEGLQVRNDIGEGMRSLAHVLTNLLSLLTVPNEG
jgi:hypothetical protein